MDNLDDLRVEIDEIDRQLIELFEKRMDVVARVAGYKEKNGLPILDSRREKQVIAKNVLRMKDKELQPEAEEFFEQLMGISRRYQAKKVFTHDVPGDDSIIEYKKDLAGRRLRIGFQGVSGSFSEQALHEYFGENVDKTSVPEFEDVFKELQKGTIDYGVLPIENSSTGSILAVYDLLRKYDFFITGEKCIDVQQNLLGLKGAKLADITEVYTIPTAFEQSRDYFKDHPGITFIPYLNTAASAEYVKNTGDIHKAAIASKRAAKIFGLDIIGENINYSKNNRTRFIIVGRKVEVNERCGKISMVFALEHKVGSLYNVLRFFSENNLNMLKIESRPIVDKSWQYFFYIDIEGNMEDVKVRDALKLIDRNSIYFRLLGNYQSSR
jgi:monofunctional chorismate mutase, gram positive-type, clade 2